MERDNVLERKLNSLQASGRRQGRDFKDSVATFRRLSNFYPQALYPVGINPNKLEMASSSAMVYGGISRRRGSNAGDATRKQQMAVENAILDAVKKTSKNEGDRI